MKDLCKLAGLPLVATLALSSAGCRDDDRPVILDGAYTASEAYFGTLELTSAGYILASHFTIGVAPHFQMVLVPPDSIVQTSQVAVGSFDYAGDRIAFYNSTGELQGLADVSQSGNHTLLEFGAPMIVSSARLAPFSGGIGPVQLIGLGPLQATTLTFRNAAGHVVDILGAGGNGTLTFGEQGYGLLIQAPAGTLSEQAQTLDWPGAFATVGPSLILQGAFGCQFFGALVQIAQNGVTFKGGTCALSGQVWRVEATFGPQ